LASISRLYHSEVNAMTLILEPSRLKPAEAPKSALSTLYERAVGEPYIPRPTEIEGPPAPRRSALEELYYKVGGEPIPWADTAKGWLEVMKEDPSEWIPFVRSLVEGVDLLSVYEARKRLGAGRTADGGYGGQPFENWVKLARSYRTAGLPPDLAARIPDWIAALHERWIAGGSFDVLGRKRQFYEELRKDLPRNLPPKELDIAVAERLIARQEKADRETVEQFKQKLEEEYYRGHTFWGKVGEIQKGLVPWMLEFVATGPIYSRASQAAKSAISKVVKRELTAKVLGSLVGGTVGSAARTMALPTQVFEETMRRRIGYEDEGWATSLSKAWVKTFIEAASEESGAGMGKVVGTLGGGLKWVASKSRFSQRFLASIAEAWTKAGKARSLVDFVDTALRAGGWNGILEEIGEERLATILHAIANTEDFGLGPEATWTDRLAAGLREDLKLKNLAPEAVGLATPGVLKAGAYGLEMMQARKRWEQLRQELIDSINEASKRYGAEPVPPEKAPPSVRPPKAPTEGPPTEGPPTEGPPTEGPPTEGPPTEGPPTEGPPTEGPPTEGPPTEGPPTEEDIGTLTEPNIGGLAARFSRRIEEALKVVEPERIHSWTIRRWAADEYGVSNQDVYNAGPSVWKPIEEAAELAFVNQARRILSSGLSADEEARLIRKLYQIQPVFGGRRTSTQIENQAYSTPLPLAYEITRLLGIGPDTKVYDPTAGTGMLLMGADPRNARANEIDPVRAAALEAQGIPTTREDATTTKPIEDKSVEVVVTNPPFGKLDKPVEKDGYRLTRKEHVIAANALDAMADDGSAAIIVAAPRSKSATLPGGLQTFFNWLESRYNIAAVKRVHGKLYARMGTRWPVFLIFVEGRKSPAETAAYEMARQQAEGRKPGVETVATKEKGARRYSFEIEEDETVEAFAKGREGEWKYSFEIEDINSWEELGEQFEKLKEKMPNARRRRRTRTERKGAADTGGRGGQGPKAPPQPGPVEEPPERPPGPTGPTGAGEPGGGGVPPGPTGGPGAGGVRPGGGPGEQREPGGAPGGVGVPGPEPPGGEGGGVVSPGPEEAPAPEGEQGVPGPEQPTETPGTTPPEPGAVPGQPGIKIDLTEDKQVPYEGLSKGPDAGQKMPASLKVHYLNALHQAKEKVGDIDEFVRDQLGFDSKEELFENLSNVQIDTIALALVQFDAGRAFIIGHQTGVGKGRALAAVVKRALEKGEKIVFVTSKANLFNDFLRDLIDVGVDINTLRPLLTNANTSIFTPEGKRWAKSRGRRKTNSHLRATLNNGNWDILFTTYSQIQTGESAELQSLLTQATSGNLLLMDEAHLAAGKDSNRNIYFLDQPLRVARHVLYSSATYAKRADSMTIYGPTGLLGAFDNDIDALIASVTRGGGPLQSIIAATMAAAGVYARAEINFEGVGFETQFVGSSNEGQELVRKQCDAISDIIIELVKFDAVLEDWIKGAVRKHIGPNRTITHAQFFSHLHNIVRQFLAVLKVQPAIQEAKRSLQQGRKPIIVVDNTAQSHLKRWIQIASDYGMDRSDFSYRSILLSVLRQMMSYSVRTHIGRSQHTSIHPDELPPHLRQSYDALVQTIINFPYDLPGSPIDAIINSLRADNIRIAEITGRDFTIEPDERTGVLGIRARPDSVEIRWNTMRDFNSGELDALIMNRAAAEGVSLHASVRFKDQRPRDMILLQMPLDINQAVQIMGRIARMGEAEGARPRYVSIVLPIPAEIRPAAIQASKLKSLSANTTAKSEGVYELPTPVDLMNKYGDLVVARFILEHYDKLPSILLSGISREVLEEAVPNESFGAIRDLARKFTARMPLLPINVQEEIYEEITADYEAYIDYLNATNQNDLVHKELPLDAVLLDSRVVFPGDSEMKDPFRTPATLDRMRVRVLVRPYTQQEIDAQIDAELKDYEGSARVWIREQRRRLETMYADYTRRLKAEGREPTQAARAAFHKALDAIEHAAPGMMRLTVGGIPVICLGISKRAAPKVGNPSAPSAVRLRVAIPAGGKEATLTLSQWLRGKPIDTAAKHIFFSTAVYEPTEERYIFNGNLIAAMGIAVNPRNREQHTPQVVTYTLADGTVRTGLLMPRNFEPEAALSAQVRLNARTALVFLTNIPGFSHYVEAGPAKIQRDPDHPDRWKITVPMNRKKGGRIYLNQSIRQIVGDFAATSNRRQMVASFETDQLYPLLHTIEELGYSLWTDAEHAELGGTILDGAEHIIGRPRGPGTPEGGAEALVPPLPKSMEVPVETEPTERAKAKLKKRKRPISKHEIARKLTRVTKSTVKGWRRFRSKLLKKAAGAYWSREDLIRVMNVGNLRTLSHEIGHRLFDVLGAYDDISENKRFAVLNDLISLGLRQFASQGYDLTTLVREGAAELFYFYITGQDEIVQRQVPAAYKYMVEDFLPLFPEMAEGLAEIRDAVILWREQGSVARLAAEMYTTKPKKPMAERLSGAYLWLRTMFVDVAAPLHDLLDKYLPQGVRNIEEPFWDPGYFFEARAMKAPRMAYAFVFSRTYDFFMQPNGESLADAVSDVRDRFLEFCWYMVARQARVYHERGLDSGFLEVDFEAVIAKYDCELFRRTAERVRLWSARVLLYVAQAGAMKTEEVTKLLVGNPFYVPFMRVFQDEENRFLLRTGGRKGITKVGRPVHARTGSGRAIYDIFDSMMLMTTRLLAIADATHIARCLERLQGKYPGMGGFLTEWSPPVRVTEVSTREILKILEKYGIPIDLPEDAAEEVLERHPVIQIFRNSPVFFGKEYVVSFLVDGERKWFEVHPMLYRILEGLDQYLLPRFWHLTAGMAARAVRLGATGLNPAFGIVYNPIRDAVDSLVKGKHAGGPLDLVRGTARGFTTSRVGKMLGVDPDEAARQLIDMGISISTFIGQDRRAVHHLQGELLAKHWKDYAFLMGKHPIDALRGLFNATEVGLRVEEYRKALEWWMKKHGYADRPIEEAPPDAKMYAFLRAQDMTINYSRAGAIGRILNQVIPFWNTNIQDMSKIVRLFKERPLEALILALKNLTIPALLLWWFYKDEDWYKSRPAWEKANYIHVPLPNKKVMRLPVPFLMGHLFMSIPTAVFDAVYRADPDRVKEQLKETFDANLYPVLAAWPALIHPIVRQLHGKDWAGRPIVPEYLKWRRPEDQYLPYTTEFVKAVGKALKISPLRLEHLLNSYSGGLYRRVAKTFEVGKIQSEADWPLLGRLFTRDPMAPRAELTRFYKERDRLRRQAASQRFDKPIDYYHYKLYLDANRRLAPLWRTLRNTTDPAKRRRIFDYMRKILTDLERRREIVAANFRRSSG